MKSSLNLAVFVLFFILTSLTGCRTAPLPETRPAETEKAPPEPSPADIPKTLDIDWAGTTWIQIVSGGRPGDFPGYRGIHLGRDGRLLLINMDQAVGDRWTAGSGARGNNVSFSLISGNPALPLAGTFLAFPDPAAEHPPTAGDIVTIRLVPESRPDSPGIVLHRASVNVDILENHWIPRSLQGGDRVMWPMNREIHLMVLPDSAGMGVLGFGGENRFRGSLKLDGEQFVTGPLSITRKYGPASDFEDLYVRMISETDRFVQVADDLFLFRETRPTASFRVRLFD